MPGTIQDFMQAHGIAAESVMVDRNPHMHGMPDGSTHWLVTFTRPGVEPFAVHFSMGPAHTSEPDPASVLDCVASDVASVENEPDWLDWAESLGCDAAALRAARESHGVIRAQADALRAFLPGDALDTLLWDTERL